jgi:hypothetical protein
MSKIKGRLTAQQVNPAINAQLVIPLRLDHPKRLVQNCLTRLPFIDDLDQALRKRTSPSMWVFDEGYPSSQSELNKYAPSQCVGYIVVPK